MRYGANRHQLHRQTQYRAIASAPPPNPIPRKSVKRYSDTSEIQRYDTAQFGISATAKPETAQFGTRGSAKSETAQIGHSDTAIQAKYSDTIRRNSAFSISDKRHRHRQSASATRRQFGIKDSSICYTAQIGHSDTAIQAKYSNTIRRKSASAISATGNRHRLHGSNSASAPPPNPIRRKSGIAILRYKRNTAITIPR